MRCLCCNKIIDENNYDEIKWNWHRKCIKKFFNLNELPILDFDENSLLKIANDCIKNGYTIPGVQKKLSLNLEKNTVNRLTLVGYPSGYILKLQTSEYPQLPENEYMVMLMANEVGIKTVPFALIKNDKNEYLYITKRIDRILDKKIAMEDFCQLDLRLTEDKYKGSYERCVNVINKYSSQKLLDVTELYIRIVFSYLVGNSDMHLKNNSLICIDNKYKLCDAYDLLAVKIALNDEDDLALTLNGKNRNLRRSDFIKFGIHSGIQEKVCHKLIDRIISKSDSLEEICKNSYLDDTYKDKWLLLFKDRINKLL